MNRNEAIGVIILLGLFVLVGEAISRAIGLSRWLTIPLVIICFFAFGYFDTRRLDREGQRLEEWQFRLSLEDFNFRVRDTIKTAEDVKWTHHEESQRSIVWLGKSRSGSHIAIAIDLPARADTSAMEVTLTASRHGDAAADLLARAIVAAGAILMHHELRDPPSSRETAGNNLC